MNSNKNGNGIDALTTIIKENNGNGLDALTMLILDSFSAQFMDFFDRAIRASEQKVQLDIEAKKANEQRQRKCEEAVRASKIANKRCQEIVIKVDELSSSFAQIEKLVWRLKSALGRVSEENQIMMQLLQFNLYGKQFANEQIQKDMMSALQRASHLQQQHRQADINLHLGQRIGDISNQGGDISLEETHSGK